jgi:hypothetical protein
MRRATRRWPATFFTCRQSRQAQNFGLALVSLAYSALSYKHRRRYDLSVVSFLAVWVGEQLIPTTARPALPSRVALVDDALLVSSARPLVRPHLTTAPTEPPTVFPALHTRSRPQSCSSSSTWSARSPYILPSLGATWMPGSASVCSPIWRAAATVNIILSV